MGDDSFEPPLASLSLTHVYYNPDDPLSLISAWLALVPQAIVIAYTALLFGQREIELFLMFLGQLGCEAVNFVLKRCIKEARPTQMNGKGYGMPSSHAQFVAFFSVYISCWVFLRNRYLSPFHRTVISAGSLAIAAAITVSRVYLNYHTRKQVLAGTAAGTILAIMWFVATAFLRQTQLEIGGRRIWQWIMIAGSHVYMKDMCLEVDLVEHDYKTWRDWNMKKEKSK